MNIFNRILEFVDFKGISKNELSLQLGLSNSYMTKMTKTKGNVGSSVLEKIVRIYPELSIEWLVTGEGSMIKMQNIDQTPGNCISCPYKEIAERYKSDIDRYIKEIERLSRTINDLTSQPDPKTKALSA